MCKTLQSSYIYILLFSLKVQHLSEKLFYLELLKKREDSIEKQKVELVNQKSILLNILVGFQLQYLEQFSSTKIYDCTHI